MEIIIPKQIPIKTKLYGNGCIRLTDDMREYLNWSVGHKLEAYFTDEGIFFMKKKEE